MKKKKLLNKNANDSTFIFFQKYNFKTSELLALCTNNSLEKIQTIIQNEINDTIKELNNVEGRHFFIKNYHAWVNFFDS